MYKTKGKLLSGQRAPKSSTQMLNVTTAVSEQNLQMAPPQCLSYPMGEMDSNHVNHNIISSSSSL